MQESSYPPISDSIIIAVSKLVDDALSGTRSPSHSDLEFLISRAGLSNADPNRNGQTLGKAKRLRAVFYWSLENDLRKGQVLLAGLISHLQACGGFRADSTNYVGEEAIVSARKAFEIEGFTLFPNGELRPTVLEGLSGAKLTEALQVYVRRAKDGSQDAALLAGTGKDLLEATAAHVLVSLLGSYQDHQNFPTLLGQAFLYLKMATPGDGMGTEPMNRLDRALYEAGCSINTLRNKQGTGHGRPWLPQLTDEEARTAIEVMGIIAERMLTQLDKQMR